MKIRFAARNSYRPRRRQTILSFLRRKGYRRITRAQLLEELLPGLNALFNLEYAKYEQEHRALFEEASHE